MMWLSCRGDRSMHITYISNQNWSQQLLFLIISIELKALLMCTQFLFKEYVQGTLSGQSLLEQGQLRL